MIARGGAMALFVLRLAGLLSLEKALVDNSTELLENPSALPNAFTASFRNSTALNGSSANLSSVATKQFVLSENDIDDPIFLTDKIVEAPVLSSWGSKPAEKEIFDSIGTLVANNSKPNVVRNKAGIQKVGKNVTNSKKNNSYKNSTLKLTLKTKKKLIKNNKIKLDNDFHDNDTFVGGKERKKLVPQEGKFQESKVLENYLEEPSSLPPRSSHTGFSPLITKPVNNSELPYFANAKNPFIFDQAAIPRLNTSIHNVSNKSYLSLEGPETAFVETGFDYDDYYGNDSLFIPPTLTSRSLISPVPRPGEEEAYKEYYEKEKDKKNEAKVNGRDEVESKKNYKKLNTDESNRNIETKDGNKVERTKSFNQVTLNEKGMKKFDYNDKNKKDKENFDLRVVNGSEHQSTNEYNNISTISPIFSKQANTSEPKRNNPYPYGPKFLPRQTLVSNNTDLKSSNVSGLFGKLFPEKDFLYNYDYDAFNSTEYQKEKFFVKTDKPPVLIHFHKPGYSPKLPESSLPPTRAPTPSDPWDCSPRCPRYILLDWNPDYDIRQYPVTTWISTVIIAENRILAELEGYMRVQDYFYGLNDRGKLLNITVPFVTQIKHGQHPGVLKEFTDYTVSLYIHHEDDPLNYDLPTPISNEVLVDRLESKTVFVSGFEAFVWEVTEAFLIEKVELLTEKLRQNGEAFLDRYFYLASYNRPELYQPLYYELWIYATTFRDNVALQVPPMAPRRRPTPNHITIKTVNKLCRGVECPSFEVLRTYRYGIQKRRYFDGIFVTTSPGVCQFSTLSVWKGFMPLHLYKHGINSHMEVIEATRPIALVHVKEDSTSHTECPQNMTMAIYLPKRLHSNPPLTGYDAPRVEVSALQDVIVYAYTVGGYLLEPDRVRKELADLKYRLTEFGACFKNDEYYIVVYDFIVRYHGRQNEIWVVAENCKATKNG